ncbi:hypothetical protein EG68_04861 [Paragonimus skrjabini miyazakii]|uniref:Uncharacterized protein n=1 Tax=Paragonimus skrjabini miyazakii TaxID=59628 RepID=A0A8S9YYI9_9TREM|nr:hypothetical protein EG68_04861 [Paragonimus skrjabini miyazakii]
MSESNRHDRVSALNITRANCHASETFDSAVNSATIASSAAVRGTLFDRLWRRVRRNPRSSTCSTDSSPALSPTPDRHASPLFGNLDKTQVRTFCVNRTSVQLEVLSSLLGIE